MTAGPPAEAPALPDDLQAALPAWLRAPARWLARINGAMAVLGMLALLAASVILTWSVVSRYFLRASTDWQDEAAVFCLVGATFLCGAFVQRFRGHVGIEAIAGLMPAPLERVRLVLVDGVSLLFCGFFAWKSWTLFHEAWVERWTTSSSWAPPLAIPYALMAAGMGLLAAQLLLQFAARVRALRRPALTPARSREEGE